MEDISQELLPPKKNLLSTSSPEGIQIASKITPTRLANLLIRKGPLPIRHITNQLALEVIGFDQLSLSKQRRLIMAAMEQTDKSNNVVFEKIGWGQWAVRKVDSNYIFTEGTESNNNVNLNELNGNGIHNDTTNANGIGGNDLDDLKHINVNDLRNQPNLKLGWSKKKVDRRESITTKNNLHNIKVPNEKLSTSAIMSDSDDDEQNDNDEDDEAIEDIMEDAIEDESSSEEESSGSDELFKFDHDLESKRSPPIKFANRVPLKLSPPPTISNSNSNSRRKSSSSNSVNKNTNYKHQIFNRSRLNSLENLDNYIISSAKNSSNVSFNSPPPQPTQLPGGQNISIQTMSGSPLSSWSSTNYNLSKSPDGGRRKSSFNESSIRSTLSSSIPTPNSNSIMNRDQINVSNISIGAVMNNNNNSNYNHNGNNNNGHKHGNKSTESDTDEEDWATIGAESLRTKKSDSDETKAALALVDLMSV